MDVKQIEADSGVELRRYQDTLAVVGMGTLVFSIWSIIKGLLSLYFRFEEYFPSVADPSERWHFMTISLTEFLVFMSIEFGLRLIVGIRAIRFGRRQTEKRPELISICLLLLINAVVLVMNVWALFNGRTDEPMDAVLTIIIDLTVLITEAEMLHAAIKVRNIIGRSDAD